MTDRKPTSQTGDTPHDDTSAYRDDGYASYAPVFDGGVLRRPTVPEALGKWHEARDEAAAEDLGQRQGDVLRSPAIRRVLGLVAARTVAHVRASLHDTLRRTGVLGRDTELENVTWAAQPKSPLRQPIVRDLTRR